MVDAQAVRIPGRWRDGRALDILLFDDLFRSGATTDSITAALYEQGRASEVFALTLTRTRGKG